MSLLPLLSGFLHVALVGAPELPAQELSEPAQISRAKVVLAGDVALLAELRPTLEGLLEPFDIGLTWVEDAALSPRARLDAALEPIELWVDLGPESALLFIVDGRREHVLIRRVPIPDGFGVVEREQLAQIIETSLEAMLAGATIGIARQELDDPALTEPEPASTPAAAPPAPLPSTPAVEPRTPTPRPLEHVWLLDTAAYGRGYGLGARAFPVNLGLRFAATRRLHPRLGLGLGLELAALLPHALPLPPDSGFALELVGAHASSFARARVEFGQLYLPVDLGLGLELRDVSPEALVPDADAGERRLELAPSVLLRAGPGVRIGANAALLMELQFALDVALRPIRYVTGEGNELFSPWPVRPGLVISLGWSQRAGAR